MGRTTRTLLASIIAVLAAAPAAQAAERCEQRDTGPRYEQAAAGSSSRVAVCDRRRGVVLTLHRGRIGGVSILDGRVAWGETRGRRGQVVVADIRSRRVLVRRSVGRAAPSGVEPALLRGGALAWTVRRSRRGPERLVLARPGRPLQGLARGQIEGLATEDGVTLRWTLYGEVRYRDVGRVPVRDGCPRRERFAPAIATPEMVVTIARYPAVATEEDEGEVVTVIRSCIPGSGKDPVVLARASSFYGPTIGVRAARAGWLVVEASTPRRDGEGTSMEWSTVHVDGRRGRVMSIPGERGMPPATAFTVTDAGVPARIEGDRVLSVDPSRRPVELDRGDVANLGAQGDAITWTNAGAPRSATL